MVAPRFGRGRHPAYPLKLKVFRTAGDHAPSRLESDDMTELQERPSDPVMADEPLTAISLALGDLDLHEKIERLAGAMFELPTHTTEFEVRHFFAHGLYGREMTIRKGVMAIGKVHCQEHLFIISAGEISVLTEDGVKRLKAPCTFVTQPGAQRVVYAHEDTVVTTIHATTDTCVESLEKSLVAKTFAEYEMRLLASPGSSI